MEQIKILDTTPRKTLTQITKFLAGVLFRKGNKIKILNERTGKIRGKNATEEEIYQKNMSYFIIK